jgi:hypothetical protein
MVCCPLSGRIVARQRGTFDRFEAAGLDATSAQEALAASEADWPGPARSETPPRYFPLMNDGGELQEPSSYIRPSP